MNRLPRSKNPTSFVLHSLLLGALLSAHLGLKSLALENQQVVHLPIDNQSKSFQGEIEIDAVSSTLPKTPAQQIDYFSTKTIAEKPAYQLNSPHKVLGKVSDIAQYCTTYKGFASSSEAADVILSEKIKPDKKVAIEYLKQKSYDLLHVQITTCTLQIAMGLGTEQKEQRAQIIDDGLKKLKQLVGDQQANDFLSSLTAWSAEAKPKMAVGVQNWDVLQIQNKSTSILESVLKTDEVVEAIVNRLHKYNRHSNLSRISNKLINISLSLAALTPTIVSPAAQVTQVIYVALTGGPEESKLLKEVYLDRRLEQRCLRLTQEINLAVTNYNVAQMTHNPVLLSCSESIIKAMAGEALAGTLLKTTVDLGAQDNLSAPLNPTNVSSKPDPDS